MRPSDAQEALQREQGARLKESRLNAGFEVDEALTAFLRNGTKIGQSTYYQYESGERKFMNHAKTFAECYGVQPEFLLYGTVQRKRRVAVLGQIGADGIVLRTKGRITDTVEGPPGEEADDLGAYRVKIQDDPKYDYDDVIFYNKSIFSGEPEPESLINRSCIIEDSEGVVTLARVVSVRQGGVLIRSPSGKRRITAVHIAPIKWVLKV